MEKSKVELPGFIKVSVCIEFITTKNSEMQRMEKLSLKTSKCLIGCWNSQ